MKTSILTIAIALSTVLGISQSSSAATRSNEEVKDCQDHLRNKS